MHCAFVCTVAGLVVGGAAMSRASEPREGIEEHAALPKPGGEPTLRLDVVMPRTVWGEWEHVRFDYRIVNATKKPIPFEDGDPVAEFDYQPTACANRYRIHFVADRLSRAIRI
jgi:hypothetical protein